MKKLAKLFCFVFALFASQQMIAQSEILLEEPFAGSLGSFTVEGFNGENDNIWMGEDDYVKADAYSKISGPTENYLVSPLVTLGNDLNVAHFDQYYNFFNVIEEETGLSIRLNGGEWQHLTINYPEQDTWMNTGEIEIPAEFSGMEVQFGLRYNVKNSASAGLWKIKNFVVETSSSSVEKVDPAFSFAETDMLYILESGELSEPVLNNPNGVTVTYSSSNTAVATVDALTGEVTAIAEGSTTITASSQETTSFLAGEASYNLTVANPVTEVVFSETFENDLGKFTVEGYNGENNNIWVHDVAFATADAYGKISEPLVNYLVSPEIQLSDNNHIAHYSQNQSYFSAFTEETAFLIRTVGGEWQALTVPVYPNGDWAETGNITIPQEFNGKNVQFGFKYTAQTSNSAGVWSISNFIVEKICKGTYPKIAYGVKETVAFIGNEFYAPVISNPYGVEIVYSSSNPEVAAVDAQTGEVTIVAEGTAEITAKSIESDKFVSGTASYVITVKQASADDIIYEAYFKDNMDGFAVEGFNGDEFPIWKIKNECARADAFTKISVPTTNYLVSPVIRMSEAENTAEFNYKYLHDNNANSSVEEEIGFCIRLEGGEWEEIMIPNIDGSNTMVNSGKIIIPSTYAGKKVQVAFRYFAESGQTSGVLSVDDVVIRTSVPTGIEGITADDIENGKVYDLQGRRANRAGNGIFIVNGKKIATK